MCAEHQPQQLKNSEAAGEFQPSSLPPPLRLVCDIAALRGQCDAPAPGAWPGIARNRIDSLPYITLNVAPSFKLR